MEQYTNISGNITQISNPALTNTQGSSSTANEGLRINVEQMQLAELQKISSQIQRQVMGSSVQGPNNTSFSSISVNGHSAGGVISGGATPSQYVPPAIINDGTTLRHGMMMGGMVLNALGSNIKNASSDITDRDSLAFQGDENTFIGRTINKIANIPFLQTLGMDRSRLSAKGLESVREQSEFALHRAGLQVANTGASMAGGVMGAKLGAMAGSLIPIPVVGNLIGGMLGHSVGSAIGGGAGNVLLHQLRDQQGYSTWLQQNAYKFINAGETNNLSTGSGFTKSERRDLGRFLANLNTDFFLKDDEINTMLQGVTDAGLLKTTSDMQSFEKKFTSLVKNIKQYSKILNASYEETIQLMGDINKMGMKTEAEQMLAVSTAKAVGDYTGKTATEAHSAIKGLSSSLFSGTAVDADEAYSVASSLNVSGNNFMEMMSKYKNDPTKGAYVQQLYGDLYNRSLQQGYSGDDLAQVMASKNAQLLNYSSSTGQILMPMLAYAAEMEGGVITGFNQGRLDEVSNILSSGDPNALAKVNKLYQGMNQVDMANITTQLQQKGEAQTYALLTNSVGVGASSRFINTSIDAIALTDGLISKNDVGTSKAAAELFGHMGLGADTGKDVYAYNQYLASGVNEQVTGGIEKSTIQQAMRQNSLGNTPTNPLVRLANTLESWAQTVSSQAPKIGRKIGSNVDFFGNIGNWWLGQDTAQREGYGTVAFDSSNYMETYNKLAEYGYETSGNLELDKTSKIISGRLNWNAIKEGRLGLNDIFISNLNLKNNTKVGESTKLLRTKIENDSSLTDKQKEELLAQIESSEQQTQSATTGYLELAENLAGENFRKGLKKSIKLKGFGIGKTIDDLALQENIEDLDLSTQRQIQEFLPEAIASNLLETYNNKDVLKMVENMAGKAQITEEDFYKSAIEDKKITQEEMTTLLKEFQKIGYTDIGNSESMDDALSKDIENYLGISVDGQSAIKDGIKSMTGITSETSKLIKENNEQQQKLNTEIKKNIKKLEREIVALKK